MPFKNFLVLLNRSPEKAFIKEQNSSEEKEGLLEEIRNLSQL